MYTDHPNTVFKALVFFFWGMLLAMAQQETWSPPLPQPPFDIHFSLNQRYTVLKVGQRTIDSTAVGTFLSQPGKAQVRESFQNAVLSGEPRVYPFEYQYYVQPSPDKNKYLIYHYDYSQPTLQVFLKVLDTQWKVIASLQLPVDDGLVSHGYWIDNQGYIYAIHTGVEDAVYVMRYNSATSEADWLELGADIMHRNRFVPFFENDHIVSVAAIVEDAHEQWKGVLISTFDFQKKRLADVYLYMPSAGFPKSQLKLATGRYEITSFAVQNGQKIISLQKVAILANKYSYNPYAVLNPLNIAARKQQVQRSEKIIVQINEQGKVKESTAETSRLK